MGIDKLRFTEAISIPITQFFCGMCGDVVDDPILTKECEHCLCRACVLADIKFCPTCGIKVNGFDEFGTALKRIYVSIKLRCVYTTCKESLTIETYKEHERKCPHGFYECPNLCGFKIRLSLDEALRAHNCIEILRSAIGVLEASNADLQSINDKLNFHLEKLKEENAGLLSTIGSQKKRRVTCGTVLAQGETFYRCYTCQIRRMSVICVDCFQVELHQKHRYALLVAEANNYYCDCGDTATLLQSSTCPKHSVK